jgi:hypothetical protein
VDERAFDLLSKAVAGRVSRREGFRLVLATVLGTTVGYARRHEARAALCQERVRNPSYTPTSNGCGSGWSAYIVPEKYKKARFTDACNTHDICYGTCNNDRDFCDTQFSTNLIAACAAAYPLNKKGELPDDYYDCVDRARNYYQAVQELGRSAYEEAQGDACICCEWKACGDKCCDGPVTTPPPTTPPPDTTPPPTTPPPTTPPPCGPCGDCQECRNGACSPIDCGSPCLVCVSNSCQPKCTDLCAPCDANGQCTRIDCGSPCLECRDGACFEKACGPCQQCNASTGQCESACSGCQTCRNGTCVDSCIMGCQACQNGGCANTCPSEIPNCCPSSDGTYGACIPNEAQCCHTADGAPLPFPRDQPCPVS